MRVFQNAAFWAASSTKLVVRLVCEWVCDSICARKRGKRCSRAFCYATEVHARAGNVAISRRLGDRHDGQPTRRIRDSHEVLDAFSGALV
jgi:hypothetical protein